LRPPIEPSRWLAELIGSGRRTSVAPCMPLVPL